MDELTGGDKLMQRLNDMQRNLDASGTAPSVAVGFLAGATYPNGTPIAYIAAIQEFGGSVNREPGEVTLYRQVNAKGTAFNRKGRFVKKAKSNFSTTHAVGAYTITIPPRPFFRTMIRENRAKWPADIAKLLKAQNYNPATVLGLMGERIKGQLVKSIKAFTTPPNAPSTIRKKGFDKPLIDTGVMWNSVDYRVSE